VIGEVVVSREITIDGPIALGAFLKLSGAVATGGEAKQLIQGEAVRVNGEVEVRRGHKIVPGDEVVVGGTTYVAAALGRPLGGDRGPGREHP
jgi:ribosome-associated protein